jgi:predicted negative regulator of RcsB-dependent stress response
MKRDEVLDWMGRTVAFVRGNAKLVLTMTAVVVLGAVVTFAIVTYRGKETDRANRLLTEAIAVFEAPIDSVSSDPDEPRNPTFSDPESRRRSASAKLESVREEFGSRPVGAIAAAYLGDLAAESGELETAEALWREALDGVGDSLLAGRLQLNLINLARSQGREEEAVEQLRALLNDSDSPLPGDVLLFQLASTLEEMGRQSEAASAYEQLLEEHDTSPYSSDARRKLDEL